MLYRTFGKTGKDISVIGFGGMRLENPQDIDTNAELLIYAHSKGINFFDTAPGYCQDKSEEIFGAAFKHLPRESFYCSSKSSAVTASQFRADLERSLKRLNVEKIDFFHIWYIIKADEWPSRKAGGAIAEAHKAKQEGLIGHVVASLHLTGDEICEIIREGLLEGVTIGYNVTNFPFRQKALTCAQQMGIGVITMNPLGGGLIPDNPERFDFIRQKGDHSVVEAALRFNLSHPAITCALVGFSKKEHIDQAIHAVENFTPYTQEQIEQIKTNIEEGFNDLCTQCGYCLPCPAGVEIPKLMEAYNHRILGRSDQDIIDRLRWHWGLSPQDARKCTQCGQCQEKCTQHLPIIERLKHIANLTG